MTREGASRVATLGRGSSLLLGNFRTSRCSKTGICRWEASSVFIRSKCIALVTHVRPSQFSVFHCSQHNRGHLRRSPVEILYDVSSPPITNNSITIENPPKGQAPTQTFTSLIITRGPRPAMLPHQSKQKPSKEAQKRKKSTKRARSSKSAYHPPTTY